MRFELPDGTFGTVGGKGKDGTRRMFPQVTSDLSVRWCSAYLKIDVCAAALRNDPRFAAAKVLLVTGERAEESRSRARYATCEVHKSSTQKRTVHQWRPVHAWDEKRVWDALCRHRIRPHPAYELGFGRVSCASCIFGGDGQWRTIRDLFPERFDKIAHHEEVFKKTIHRQLSVLQRASRGMPFIDVSDPATRRIVDLATREDYEERVVMGTDEVWTMPAGAFKDTGGPT